MAHRLHVSEVQLCRLLLAVLARLLAAVVGLRMAQGERQQGRCLVDSNRVVVIKSPS